MSKPLFSSSKHAKSSQTHIHFFLNHLLKRNPPTTFKNSSGSSSWGRWLDSANRTHFTFSIDLKKGSITLSCASSYFPLMSRVGAMILWTESTMDQVFRVPDTKNSEGPFLSYAQSLLRGRWARRGDVHGQVHSCVLFQQFHWSKEFFRSGFRTTHV